MSLSNKRDEYETESDTENNRMALFEQHLEPYACIDDTEPDDDTPLRPAARAFNTDRMLTSAYNSAPYFNAEGRAFSTRMRPSTVEATRRSEREAAIRERMAQMVMPEPKRTRVRPNLEEEPVMAPMPLPNYNWEEMARQRRLHGVIDDPTLHARGTFKPNLSRVRK
jgi:hypothetical protein